jgi:MoxR-like ATPase
MPKRSKIATLPAEVRKYLDRALIEGNFSGYEALEAELAKRGVSIGKSSIHRYGAQLERRLAAIKASTEAAVMIMDAAPDDQDARSGAIVSLVQTELFDTIMKLQEAADADPAARVKLLSAAAKNIATLTRASVGLKKWQVEIRNQVKAVADRVARMAKKGGFSAKTADDIRREILGIAT